MISLLGGPIPLFVDKCREAEEITCKFGEFIWARESGACGGLIEAGS
jgi:hypothetical protein